MVLALLPAIALIGLAISVYRTFIQGKGKK